MERYHRNPYTLSFFSSELEASFLNESSEHSVRQVRYAACIGIFLLGPVWGALDMVTAPLDFRAIWIVRSVLVLLAVGFLVLTFRPGFRKHMQEWTASLALAAGLSLVLMIVLDTSNSAYYDGPLLLVLPAYVMLRLRFIYASIVGWIVLAAYLIALIAEQPDLTSVLIDSLFLLTANLVGMFVAYQLEEHARTNFTHEHLLEDKNRQIERMMVQRSRFFANVSHEFRTPLTPILGPVRDMLDGLYGPVVSLVQSQLEIVRRSALRLQVLINQLLDIAKLEAGSMQLHADWYDANSFIRRIVLSFSSMAERNGVALQFHATDGILPFFFDPDKLEKILSNLLSNAFKFTPAPGKIRVEVSQPDEGLTIVVQDTGEGIPEEVLPFVFDRFSLASDSIESNKLGTGIGLSLTRELIEMHHGTIEVESSPGFGTRFIVCLPIYQSGEEPADLKELVSMQAVPAEPAGFELLLEDDKPDSQFSQTETLTDAPLILMVDDSIDLRAYLRQHLSSFYRVEEASDGNEALSRARAFHPDLVISDVMIPGLDGYTLCRKLRSDDKLRSVPVILLSARATEQDRLEGLEAGADDYIVKPFSMGELLVRIENLIELRKILRLDIQGHRVFDRSGYQQPDTEDEAL